MTGLEQARGRARRRYRGKAYQNAYVAGARAALEGRPPSACPYRLVRVGSSWRSSWRGVWLAGYQSAAPAPPR